MKKIIINTDDKLLKEKFDKAEKGLAANICNDLSVIGEKYSKPVLVEGSIYPGIWLECGPLEGLIYGKMYDIDIAVANHEIFFDYCREDGYIPCWFKNGVDKYGTGQIQMVVPIAKTAWELYCITKDDDFLEKAYNACSKWDRWLEKYRDSRGLDLCELFCEYDTGHDRSNRFYALCKGAYHECPDDDARKCHEMGTLPWLAPDLSATLFGGRKALSKMAYKLGDNVSAEFWEVKAEKTRRAILSMLFDPENMTFYDLDSTNRFMRIKGDALTRVLGEHVVDKGLFEIIFKTNIINPNVFWTPYPLPSVAVSDTLYDANPPRNSWCGPSQGLTALRAPRWFEYYGKYSELTHMMKRWVSAIKQNDEFGQELNPFTGKFSATKDYSPTMLVMLMYTAKLYGISEENNNYEFNTRIPENAEDFRYEINSDDGRIVSEISRQETLISFNGKLISTVKGCCRCIFNKKGLLIKVIGTSEVCEEIEIKCGKYEYNFTLKPNEIVQEEELNAFRVYKG